MSKKFLVFGSPLIEKQEIRQVVRCLESGWIGAGPLVQRFERDFARFKHSRHAVALSSCTAALHLALLALGVKKGDEVIVPAMTFAATANAVVHAGATPVFADCGRKTLTLDPAEVRKKITRKTKILIPVHFAGRPCEMDELMKIARRRRLKVVEDCAHAAEAVYRGRPCGTMGDVGCFSFYATKNIVTGEGGMALTDSGVLARRIMGMALHGLSRDAWRRFRDKGFKHYQVTSAGFKYNMTDLQAALGIHQLKRVERNARRRREIWARYDEAFRDLPVFLPEPPQEGTRHAFHLYTLLLDLKRSPAGRDRTVAELYRRGVGCGIHYVALHLHPFYRKTFGCRRGDFPNAEWISDRTFSLPSGPKLSDADVRDVIRVVRQVLLRGPRRVL